MLVRILNYLPGGKKHASDLPYWSSAACKVALHSSHLQLQSVFFSHLNCSFYSQQDLSLQDYVSRCSITKDKSFEWYVLSSLTFISFKVRIE